MFSPVTWEEMIKGKMLTKAKITKRCKRQGKKKNRICAGDLPGEASLYNSAVRMGAKSTVGSFDHEACKA